MINVESLENYSSVEKDIDTEFQNRKKELIDARYNEYQYKENNILYKEKYRLKWFVIVGIVGASLVSSTDNLNVIILAFVLPFLVRLILNSSIEKYNRDNDKVLELSLKELDKKYNSELLNLEDEIRCKKYKYMQFVEDKSKKIFNSKSSYNQIFMYVFDLFKLSVSNADSSSYNQFIETVFIYEVTLSDIIFFDCDDMYIQRYDFNFKKYRFNDLGYLDDCEALAFALSDFIIIEAAKVYGKAVSITLYHHDAKVFVVFKDINRNYVPAKSII